MFIFAISVVPIADAVAVSFVAPFFVTILGALVLRESVGVRRWTAIAIGFIACLIIIRPGFSSFQPAVLLVVIAALAYAFRQIVSRILSSSDLTITTVAYTGLTASFLLSIPLPLVWRTPVGSNEFILIGALATLAALAEILVIKALELTQTVVLAPIHYTLLIWGTAYGWMVFGQFPDQWTWFGSAIIFATGIYVALREWSKKNQRWLLSSLQKYVTSLWQSPIPRSCRRSSTLRSESGKRTYSITAKRMISGLVLKYLNGECFVIWRGYETARSVSSSFCLTVPL